MLHRWGPWAKGHALVLSNDLAIPETDPPQRIKVPLSQPCFGHFFGPCFRGHDEAGLLAFEALQGLLRPEARGQSAAHGDSNLYNNIDPGKPAAEVSQK